MTTRMNGAVPLLMACAGPLLPLEQAVARDAETAWLNPAGMTRLDAPEVLFSVMPFFLEYQFNTASGTTIAGSGGGN